MTSKRKAIWGWMFFDWASQPFFTLILTFIFAPYFAASVAGSPAQGQALWGFAVAAGAALVAVLAPILGATADASGRRRPWIFAFSVAYVAGACGLWLAAPGADPLPTLIAFVICLVGVEFATVFTNAMLPDLGSPKEVGRISGSGWALGYWGGLLSLATVLTLMVPGPDGATTLAGLAPILGLDPAQGEGARAAGPMSALWYLVFMLPFLLWTPDARRGGGEGRAPIRAGLERLMRTLRRLPRERSLFSFLISSMLYRDGLNGLYAFGGIYAAGALGWAPFQIGMFGVTAAFAGALGAWRGGIVDERRGPKPVILFCIVALAVVTALTVTTSRGEILFIPLGAPDAPSALPDVAFYLYGAVIGAAGGALQASSRSMLVRQAERERMGEAFGVYALAGKATGFLAPFLVGVVTVASDSQRIGVAPIVILFLLGWLLMRPVSAEGRG